jgi:hypothetical protein
VVVLVEMLVLLDTEILVDLVVVLQQKLMELVLLTLEEQQQIIQDQISKDTRAVEHINMLEEI